MVKDSLLVLDTARKMPIYGVFSGPYFPVFGLNTGKYGPEKTPYLEIFCAVAASELDFRKNFQNSIINQKVFQKKGYKFKILAKHIL